MRSALRFVPAAVLSAIIWPAVIVQDGAIDLWIDNLHLIAALIAAVVAWRTTRVGVSFDGCASGEGVGMPLIAGTVSQRG